MAQPALSEAVRYLVRQRAQGRCEYCLLHEDDSLAGHTIDHVIARKHRGPSTTDNLALACAECNRYKGSDIATLDPRDGAMTRLFDPRRDVWGEHFRLVGAVIEGRTAVGRGTAAVLQFNEPLRVRHRQHLQIRQRYPRE